MSILDLLKADGLDSRRKSNTNGGQYAGPCPGCGGSDRFLVWRKETGDRYWCRQCNKKGDAIQYLRDFRGMGYRDACKYLSITPNISNVYDFRAPVRSPREEFIPKSASQPNDTWTQKAENFLERCQRHLWSDNGLETIKLLHEKGISDNTIKTAGLGVNLFDHNVDRESWGLPPEKLPNGKFKGIWLPSGLVIPCLHDGQVVRLRIRRPPPAKDHRYVVVSGSSSRPLVFSTGKQVALVVESELDGLLLFQEAGDLVDLVALGSVAIRPDLTAHHVFTNATKILVSLDCDDAGAKAAWDFWPRTYGNKTQRWPCIRGKDPSEAWQNGLDIRGWVTVGMSDALSGRGYVINNSFPQ